MINKVISKLVTANGTTVTKFLEEPMRAGYGRIAKSIKYPAGSPLAKSGIDEVIIRDAGKEGKHIMALSKDGKCRALGLTKPSWKNEQSVIPQLKEYLESLATLKNRFNVDVFNK